MNTKARRILIVEDEPGHAEAVRRAFLAACPSDLVQVVGSLQACREALNVQVPDVLITDIKLPDGRAFELLSSSVEERSYPVIVMTSYGNEQLVVEAMKAGAMDYVVKSPETLRDMPRTVDRVFREWNLLQQGKETQAQLYIQQEELKAVYNGTTVMMCVIDKERNVLSSNQAFQLAVQPASSDMAHNRPCGIMGCVNALDSPLGCGYGSECESCPLRIAMTDTLQTGTLHSDVECELLLQHNGDVSSVVLLGSVTPMPPIQGLPRALVSLLDITDRRQVEDNRRFLSEGHKIAAQVSTELIKATSIADFDTVVNNTLRRLGNFFKVDRSYLFSFSDDYTHMSNTHEWCAPGVDSQKQHIQNQETDDLPWWKHQMLTRMPLQINNVSELPSEAGAEKKEFMAQGIRALICVPTIDTLGNLSGFIGFDTIRRVENWSEEKVAILQVIAGIIGSAYERLLSLQALQLTETKVVSILNAIDDVVVSTSIKDGTTYYVSPSYRQVFGKQLESDLAGEHKWLSMVHPDDCEQFFEDFSTSIASGSFVGEVRICKYSGEIRWVRVHSKIICDEQGEPSRYDSYVSDVTEMKLAEQKTEQHLKELEQWYRVTLNREGRVQELKTEVNKLLTKHGEQPKYGKEG